MVRYILKKMAQIHCARGSMRCNICKEYEEKKKIALLDLSPDEIELATKPILSVEIDGKKVYTSFEVLGYFESEEEAKRFASEKNIVIEKVIID
ncbi:MAG: hypothetical protein JXA54_09885 [Candidatus Heimdallarchaeota archaeon]|nr:hypothetical protein [Candidatus Heimdallarchaeota archaeon]